MTQPQPAEKVILEAQPRETFGKQNRKLRKNGSTPANIFGKNFESVSVTVDTRTFNAVFKQAGETTVIYVKLGEKEYPTLVSDMQFHPVSGELLHVDLKKVNLRQKVEAYVPLSFVGESVAVEQKNGVLLSQMEELTVSALPTSIPHAIEVDLAQLKEIGDMIRVSDLPKSDQYEITDEPDRVIVSVTEHVEEAVEPETTADAPEIITEGKEGEEEASATEPETKEE